ncbi:hypothetical protein RvY_19283 [Ramazzottius varieornatus]|uniref:Uncharacterized protein n=1 Tax=Ramazzottius varieornatus TaxID=947166 RepID=A0A1D1W8W3_RAMVA|nr:hypothetical protein RvY_19283 [Ramazzottius varieornatus]
MGRHDDRVRTSEDEDVVPGRVTDTEIRMKMRGDLPIWTNQKKPKFRKYTRQMFHLFQTGVFAVVGKTHVYFLKFIDAEMGDTPRHVVVRYSQCLFLKLGERESNSFEPDEESALRRGSQAQDEVSYYSRSEGEARFKTGNRGETHVLLDHFRRLRRASTRCNCQNPVVPCKCMKEAKRTIQADPEEFQRFSGTTGKDFCTIQF